jgi:hypothetical protein
MKCSILRSLLLFPCCAGERASSSGKMSGAPVGSCGSPRPKEAFGDGGGWDVSTIEVSEGWPGRYVITMAKRPWGKKSSAFARAMKVLDLWM